MPLPTPGQPRKTHWTFLSLTSRCKGSTAAALGSISEFRHDDDDWKLRTTKRSSPAALSLRTRLRTAMGGGGRRRREGKSQLFDECCDRKQKKREEDLCLGLWLFLKARRLQLLSFSRFRNAPRYKCLSIFLFFFISNVPGQTMI